MSTVPIVLPEDFQLQSSLLRLPVEIQHIIHDYCFAADGPIVDPVIGCAKAEGEIVPKLGINILQSCRRVYHEADRRPLFSQNCFRFTTAERARSFFNSLGDMYSACIQDVEIDARRVHTDHPSIQQEWLHYLASGSGTRDKPSESLRADAPRLRCLRLNFESWPLLPVSRIELWSFLRTMLMQVKGLARVVIVGASKGKGMAMRDPWAPVHFVGGDSVGSDDLVQRMWDAVGETNEMRKVIRWERHNGKLYLEVVSTTYLARHVDPKCNGLSAREKHTDAWPENGICTWSAYQNRNLGIIEPMPKGINPSVVE